MHDEFLHRLRKQPRPKFAARLQARLRRQSTSPLRPAAPSRVRTILTLLLLGGTAFAVTSVMMRGLPPSFLELYQYTAGWIRAERARPPPDKIVNQGVRQGSGWDASTSSSPHAAAGYSGSAHAAASAASAQAEGGDAAGSSGGSPSRGAGGFGIPHVRAVTSWAAYPYVAALAAQLNVPWYRPGFVPMHMDISVRDSDVVRRSMCSGDASAPEMAYAFEPAGTVSDRPCPPDASGHPSSVIAIPRGYEALVLARSPLYGELDLTRRQIFLALAKWVPDPAQPGRVRENASKTWRQVDAALGAEPLEFMGPPLASAAGHSMIELLMEGGCNTYPWIAALESTDPARHARICRTVRTDVVYVEVSGLDSTRLLAEPNAVGIIGSPLLFGLWGTDEAPQLEGLFVSKVDGVAPTRQGIESGAYPGSRGLYLYINRELLSMDHRRGLNAVLRLLRLESVPSADWALLPLSPQQSRAAYDEVMRP